MSQDNPTLLILGKSESDLFKSKIFHFKNEEWGSIWNSLGRITTFLGKFIKIGSLFPSSHWLCEQMVAEIEPPTSGPYL